MYIKIAPIANASTTDDKIPDMIIIAFPALIYWPKSANDKSGLFQMVNIATASEAPSNSNTKETVVEVDIFKRKHSRMKHAVASHFHHAIGRQNAQ